MRLRSLVAWILWALPLVTWNRNWKLRRGDVKIEQLYVAIKNIVRLCCALVSEQIISLIFLIILRWRAPYRWQSYYIWDTVCFYAIVLGHRCFGQRWHSPCTVLIKIQHRAAKAQVRRLPPLPEIHYLQNIVDAQFSDNFRTKISDA